MIIVPHSNSLSSGSRPWVTWGIMALCLILHVTLSENAVMALAYYPDELNPLRMISSALVHANWWHIIGNLIFFNAFATAVEIVFPSRLQYLGTLILISIIDSLSYSLYCVITGEFLPTLGLSGVVMGTIGLSAAMIPHARIRVLIQLFFYAWNFRIPAWALAAFYIGGNAIDLFQSGMDSGINFLSHLTGGISGYLIGKLAYRRYIQEIREDIDDLIHYDNTRKAEIGLTSLYIGNRRAIQQRFDEKARQQEQARFLDTLHRLSTSGQDGEAIMLITEDAQKLGLATEYLESLHEHMRPWPPSRTRLCLARLLINQYMEGNKPGKALRIAREALETSPQFVLANPAHLLPLAEFALENQDPETAWALIRDLEQRYPYPRPSLMLRLREAELDYLMHQNDKRLRAQVRKILASTKPGSMNRKEKKILKGLSTKQQPFQGLRKSPKRKQ